MYGGTNAFAPAAVRTEGLSPRVRGNPKSAAPCSSLTGSIPACTGEPPSPTKKPWICTVYPRVYGGTGTGPVDRIEEEGLSPRVRGNHRFGFAIRRYQGSIPACTGEPWKEVLLLLGREVYPRVYGGTRDRRDTCSAGSGLSPRVRGNPGLDFSGDAATRSIPACTGEPLLSLLDFLPP